ncbi:MAG: TIR domain-containing protein, partial [Rhodothermales bacterium]|nr:TIR domain-containing protein [Rhodothermales bacterium]
MNTQDADGRAGARTEVLLSFSRAYADLARRLATDLRATNLAVRYDQWEGGGGAPAFQSVDAGVGEAAFVVPLLTPSDAAATWVGDAWRRTIYDAARARGVDVLPVRGEGGAYVVPDFLRDRSFADLDRRDYALELRRLVETIRRRSGDAGIVVPAEERAADTSRPEAAPSAHPVALEVGEALAPLLDGDAERRFFHHQMIPLMRDGLFYELGVEFPDVHLRVGADVPTTSVQILIDDVPEAEVAIRPGAVMVDATVEAMTAQGVAAAPALNPATGATCAWIPAGAADAAMRSGHVTWDAYGVLTLWLS